MHLEDFLTLFELGKIYVDLAVEAAGPHQGLVEDVGTVGGRQDDDAAVGAEAVHLSEKGIQGIFALVVGRPAGILATGASDGVDLVDEDDAGCLILGLLEQITDTRGANADKHFDEVGAGNGEEGHVGLPCHGLRQKRLTGPRRAHQQRPFGNLAAEGGIFLGILEEVDNLHNLLFGAVQTGHIFEGDVDLGLVGEFAGGLAYIERIAAGAESAAAGSPADAAEHPDPHENQENGPEDPLQDVRPHVFVVLELNLKAGGRGKGLVQRTEGLLRVEFVTDQEEEMR